VPVGISRATPPLRTWQSNLCHPETRNDGNTVAKRFIDLPRNSRGQ
jgi:hypothetical protein